MSRGNHPTAQHQSIRAAETKDGLRVEAWSGILPPPHELQVLEQICPGTANRLLMMAEARISNNFQLGMAESKLEDRTLEIFSDDLVRSHKERSRGQWIAAGLVLLSIVSSVACALTGHDTVAGVLAGSSITTVVAAFVLGRSSKLAIRPSEKLPVP